MSWSALGEEFSHESRLQKLETSNVETVGKLAEHSTKLDYLANGVEDIRSTVNQTSTKLDEIAKSIAWFALFKKVGAAISIGFLGIIGERFFLYLWSIK